MHIKFLKHGTGSTKRAIRYLMASHDHKGQKRANIQTLRGNPDLVADVGDSLQFKYKYTSGVIAFAPEDKPTTDQIEALLDDFEKLSFSGLQGNQYTWTAVLHREDDGGCHIHVIAPRVELQSGKSLNIAPPGWEKEYDTLRDMWNLKSGWASPADPRRARILQPGESALYSRLQSSMNPKKVITEYLLNLIEAGAVSDRQGVLVALKGARLTISRAGKKYISVRLSEGEKPVRLRGVIFGEDFKCDGVARAATAEKKRRAKADRDNHHRAEREASEAFEQRVRQRADYHEGRYGRPQEEELGDPFLDTDRLLVDRAGSGLDASPQIDELSGGISASCRTGAVPAAAERSDLAVRGKVLRPTAELDKIIKGIENESIRDSLTQRIGKVEQSVRVADDAASRTIEAYREQNRRLDEAVEIARRTNGLLSGADRFLRGIAEGFRAIAERLTQPTRKLMGGPEHGNRTCEPKSRDR